MSKFKVGDEIMWPTSEGVSYKLLTISKEFNKPFKLQCLSDCASFSKGQIFRWHTLDNAILVNKTNKNIMSIKEKFVSAFLSEPEKTFRKAGITNGDGFLTEEGQEIFLSFLLKKNGDDFKKEVVDALVEEDK